MSSAWFGGRRTRLQVNDDKPRVLRVTVNTASERWYRASLRHDMRELGWLGGEETDEEREILKQGPPHASTGDTRK